MKGLQFLFVYGTLLKGKGNHNFLEGADFIGKAETVDNYTMYSNGSFPAITLQPTYSIVGEVYFVDADTLKHVDRLEGYYPDNEHNHYERKLIDVVVEGGVTVSALVYYYKDDTRLVDDWKLPSGDFAKYHGRKWKCICGDELAVGEHICPLCCADMDCFDVLMDTRYTERR